MHDHNPTDDGASDREGPTPDRPTDDAIHAAEMTDDDGTPMVHYSDGVAGHWVRADRAALVALEDCR